MKLDVHLATGYSDKETFGEKVQFAFQQGVDWFMRNKEIIIVLVPVVIGGITTIVQVVGKRSNLSKQEAIKNLYCYDRQLGHYWTLRRELSNKEWLMIDARKKSGERLANILSELRVLK